MLPGQKIVRLLPRYAASIRSIRLDLRAINQLGCLKSLSPRTVKKDLVAIRFPDGGELRGARSMQTEVDATWFIAPQQDSFGHRKRTGLELILIANRLIDVLSKIFHAADLLQTSQHF